MSTRDSKYYFPSRRYSLLCQIICHTEQTVSRSCSHRCPWQQIGCIQLISIGAQCHLVVSLKPSNALHFHQLLECFQRYFVKWLKVWCCFSLCSVSGPLCAGVVGKKKKKMMYLTTKNAGNFIWALGKMIHYLVIFFFFFLSQFDLLLLPD